MMMEAGLEMRGHGNVATHVEKNVNADNTHVVCSQHHCMEPSISQ